MLDLETTNPHIGGPLICDTEETQRLLPLSRTTLWELGKEGKLEVVHIGRRRFFTYDSICNFVESLKAQGAIPHD